MTLESVQTRWQFKCDGCGAERGHGKRGPGEVVVPTKWYRVSLTACTFPNKPVRLARYELHFCPQCWPHFRAREGV